LVVNKSIELLKTSFAASQIVLELEQSAWLGWPSTK